MLRAPDAVALKLMASCLGLAACGDVQEPEPFDFRIPAAHRSFESSAPTATSSVYRVVEVPRGATIRGRVRFRGRRPYPPELPVPRRRDVCGTSQPFAPVITDSQTGGLAGVVVSLARPEQGLGVAATEVPVRVHGCRFAPEVVVAAVGSRLRFGSADETVHSVQVDNPAGHQAVLPLPGRGATAIQRLDRAGRWVVTCQAGHPWERLEVHVFEHPYATVTDRTGLFELANVPPGEHEVLIRHHGFPSLDTTSGRPSLLAPLRTAEAVSVVEGQVVEVEVDLELSG